jgi:NitT/TauT family transport system substrate-binding protein
MATAEMLSRDGAGYLPMPAEVVIRAMTYYDASDYSSPDAIRNAGWGNGRIDFAPYPYPSATRELVRNMNETLVEGDRTFLNDLDPDFVAQDLVDDRFVKEAIRKYPQAHPPLSQSTDPWRRTEEINL